MRFPMRLVVPGFLVAMALGNLLVACGGVTSPPTGEARATAADVESMCQAMCDQHLRCQGSVDSECTQRCITKVALPHILSRDALALYERCTRDPACLDDKDCEAAVRARDAAIDKEMAACSAFVRSCPSQIEGGLCLRIGPLLAEVRAKWSACYSGTCSDTGQFLDCLEAASMP